MKATSPLISIVIALLAGALLPFAFSPYHFYGIAFLSPAVLLALWLKSPAKGAFYQGLFFGLGFFGVGVSWVYISIHDYGNADPFLAALITGVFVLILAFFIAITGRLFSLFFKKAALPIQCLCAFPALWVISEAARAWVGSGFPWLFLGYSQTPSPLMGYAALFGVYGVSLLVCMISGAIVLLFMSDPRKIKMLSACFILIVLVAGEYFTHATWTQPSDRAINASLIQGNVPQTLKWSPDHLLSILQHYRDTTEQHWESDLIVWPEAAIPTYPRNVEPFIQSITREAKKHKTALLIGAPLYHNNTRQAFNGMLLLGERHGVYLKHHLVPFGEYIPLASLFEPAMQYFNIPMSTFTPGPAEQSPLIASGISIAPFICYEIAYPFAVLNSMHDRELILVISDDSWFGNSMASPQQLQMAQMRARETGRPVLYSTNTGVTAFISRVGTIVKRLPINKAGVLTATVIPMTGDTPLLQWKQGPIVFAVLLFLLLSLFSAVFKAKNLGARPRKQADADS